jgi:hypothetical protein
MQRLSDFNIDNTPTESWAILKLQNLKLEMRELEQLPILNVFVRTYPPKIPVSTPPTSQRQAQNPS